MYTALHVSVVGSWSVCDAQVAQVREQSRRLALQHLLPATGRGGATFSTRMEACAAEHNF